MENKIEILEIDIPSPIEGLNIGEDFFYEGQYVNGYEEGVSKITRIYKEVVLWDGKEFEGGTDGVWMQLENNKLVLLGFLEYKVNFCLSDNFRLSDTKS